MPKITKLRVSIFIAAACLCIGIFWEPLLSSMLESYLRGYCRKCWNSELTLEKIERKDGMWVIEKPSIISSVGLEEGGRNLQADRILIHDSWDVFRRNVDLDVTFVAPRIDIGQSDKKTAKDSSSSFLDISLPNFPLMSVDGRVKTEQGFLTIHGAQPLSFQLDGFWGSDLRGQLTLWLGEHNQESDQIVLSLNNKDKMRTIDIDCHQTSCKVLSDKLGKLWPALADWKFEQGTINGQMKLVIPSGPMPSYIVGDAKVEELIVKNPTLQLVGNIPEVRLHIPADLSNSLNPAEGSCELTQKGSFVLQREENLSWEVTDLSGGIYFHPKNKMEIAFNGFCRQGEQSFPIHVVSKSAQNANTDMELQVSGRGSDLAMIVPQVFREGLEQKFAQDQLSLVASIKKIYSGIHLEGVIEVIDALYNDKDTIQFGCDLYTDNSNASHEWAGLSHWQDLDLDTMSVIMPAFMVWKQPNHSGINVGNGWFSAQDLPLDKYIGAVVFSENELQLDGTADLKGTFDQNRLSLKYDVHDFLLDHAYFTLSIDQFSDADAPQSAVHFIDFTTGDYNGFVPLHNASYIDKNSGLTFTGINAQITFEPHKLHAADVETFCHGLYLAGTIDLDYSHILEGYADVDIHSHTMEGKIANVKELISHFNDTPFLQECPFDGNISFRKEGGYIRFAIQPEGVQIDSRIQGAFSDGALTCKNRDVALRDLSSNFEYDHTARSLEFTDIQGTFLVGSHKQTEEYVFAGDHIRLTDIAKGEGEFDIWVGDKTRDVIRLAGKTQPLDGQNGLKEYVEFILDNSLSHIGDVHPDSFQLVLRDWSHVEKFGLSLNFQLNSLLQDVQRFSKTGVFSLSKGLLKGFNDLKGASGDFRVDVQYDDKTAQYIFNAKGVDVAIGEHRCKNCILSGKKKDNVWGIDQLQLDDLSFAADFSEGEGFWKVNFLGIRYGKSFLAGLQGEYFPHEHLFEVKINLLDIDLAQLHEWPVLKSSFEKFNLKGELHATGTAQLEFVKERPKWRGEADLKLSLKNCEMQGMRLQDAQNISCNYVSTRGIRVENLQTAIHDSSTQQLKANVFVRKADYDFANHEIIVDDLRFKFAAENLPWITDRIQRCCPNGLNPMIHEAIGKMKMSGPIEGSIDVTRSEQHRTVKLSLSDGRYYLNQTPYDLRNFAVVYDPLEFHLRTEYIHQNTPIQISLRSRSPSMESGELIIGEIGTYSQLLVHWLVDQKWGLTIQRAEGSLNGITAKLTRLIQADSNELSLTGEIIVDVHQASSRFPQDIRTVLDEWQIGGNYTLKGNWSIAPGDLLAWEDRLFFQGEMEGRNCTAKGHLFDSLSAQVESTPKIAKIKQLRINDISGSAVADSIEISRGAPNQWMMKTPLLTVKQFQPSLLRSSNGSKQPSESTFVFRQCEVKDFSGNLLNPLSFSANGRAYVANPPKREKPNQFMNLPAQAIDQYGLELSVLFPVAGAIDYEIENGRVYFKKFKDMYSAGKMSRFYLPKHTEDRSYIDFNGNLHLQVRMKQYNLLFKLAELFTVTIEGTVQKPTFALFKSTSKEKDKDDIANED